MVVGVLGVVVVQGIEPHWLEHTVHACLLILRRLLKEIDFSPRIGNRVGSTLSMLTYLRIMILCIWGYTRHSPACRDVLIEARREKARYPPKPPDYDAIRVIYGDIISVSLTMPPRSMANTLARVGEDQPKYRGPKRTAESVGTGRFSKLTLIFWFSLFFLQDGVHYRRRLGLTVIVAYVVDEILV